LIQRLILAIVAIAAMAAASAVAVVAASYAIFVLLKPQFGSAGAAGSVTGIYALLIALAALAVWLKTRPAKSNGAGKAGSSDTVARLMQLARERPIIAAGALVAGSVVALRNPAITALVLKSFFDSKKPAKR
jgi:hypothetical protein